MSYSCGSVLMMLVYRLFLLLRLLTLLTCFWNASLSTKSFSPPAPSWCGMSNCAACRIVSLSSFPRALRPIPLNRTCLLMSSKGILPHHKWLSLPWFVVGGVVVGKPLPLSRHHVLRNVASLSRFLFWLKFASVYLPMPGWWLCSSWPQFCRLVPF